MARRRNLKIHLVRHSKAASRTRWKAPDSLRPLTERGHRQAQGVVELLRNEPLELIVSSPYLRCRQTVAPLAAARGLPLDVDASLAEGADVQVLRKLVESLRGRPAVLCGHGDTIPELLEILEEEGARLSEPGSCEKGSIWTLSAGAADVVEGVYRSPLEAEAGPERSLGEEQSGAASLDRLGAPVPQRVAVLDLGSTSFHLLVADVSADGTIVPVLRERIMLRLGAVIANDRFVPEDVCVTAIETAGWLGAVAEQSGAERLLPVATAALRSAENGAALAEAIGEVVDEPVRILSGEEEARVIHTAIRRRIVLGHESIVALDLGGGSLEIAVDDEARVEWERTLPLGVARVHRKVVEDDPMSEREVERVRRRVVKKLERHVPEIRGFAPTRCVATGGTVAALARLLLFARGASDPRAIQGLRVGLDELDELVDRLVEAPYDARLRMPGMKRRRADLLPTGGLILATVLRELGFDEVTVSDWGLREGVILEACGLAP